MKQYISEGRAIYEDMYHGAFSKRLAEWAISKMMTEEGGTLKRMKPHSLDEMKDAFAASDREVPSDFIYTAWYLYNMSYADYPKTLKTDAQRVSFVEETLSDPDGSEENVLDCFVTKMCNANIPIYWEDMV